MRCPFAGEPDGDGVERPRYADVSDGGGSYMERRPGARPRRCLFADVELEQARRQLAQTGPKISRRGESEISAAESLARGYTFPK